MVNEPHHSEDDKLNKLFLYHRMRRRALHNTKTIEISCLLDVSSMCTRH